MECADCFKNHQNIELLNNTITSLLTGYEILFKVVTNHENALNQLKFNEKKTVENTPETHENECSPEIKTSSQIPVNAYEDIMELSNVNIDDEFNLPSNSANKLKSSSIKGAGGGT